VRALAANDRNLRLADLVEAQHRGPCRTGHGDDCAA
jgi:hypothetical protein